MKYLLFLLVAVSPATYSEIYKCTSGDGHITYSEEPCTQQPGVVLDIDTSYPPAKHSSTTGLRPGEIRFLRDIEQRDKARTQKRERLHKQAAREAQADERREEKCLRYRKKIKDIRREMRSGYTARRGNWLNEKMVEYKGEVRTWCR